MLDARTRLRRWVVGIRREDGTWSSVHHDTRNIDAAPVIASRPSVDCIPLPADPTASRSSILLLQRGVAKSNFSRRKTTLRYATSAPKVRKYRAYPGFPALSKEIVVYSVVGFLVGLTVRILLKIVAIVIAFSTISTLALAWRFWHFGAIKTLAASGAFGWSTILGWALTLALGPFATIQLWRLRRAGRLSALVIIGYCVSYYVLGWMLSRHRAIGPTLFLRIAFYVLVASLLLLPSAREACSEKSTSTS